jgi:two-component system response regulator
MEEVMSSAVELLLVEDNPDEVALVLRALGHHSMAERAVVVRDGAEALDFLFGAGAYVHRRLEDRPKVILLDLKLPKVTGQELLQRLKADARTRSIPVVIFTSSVQERDLVESYQSGVNSYVLKPLDGLGFAEAVGQIGRYWLELNRPAPG